MTKEDIFLFIVFLILIGVVYYMFIYAEKPTNNMITIPKPSHEIEEWDYNSYGICEYGKCNKCIKYTLPKVKLYSDSYCNVNITEQNETLNFIKLNFTTEYNMLMDAQLLNFTTEEGFNSTINYTCYGRFVDLSC